MTIPLTASALRSAPIPLPSSPVAERPLSFDTYGDSGPWVVLVHGIPGWRGTFAEVGARLGSTCRVLVPDLLGFGDSPEAPADFHAEQHAAVVIDLLRARGVDRFHLVGFDFGVRPPFSSQVGSETACSRSLWRRPTSSRTHPSRYRSAWRRSRSWVGCCSGCCWGGSGSC
ncbi:MAG: alpha/beta fold hydrolase [Myxococcales bacterium]|nr:alpha/beta fold hydrolase [Myxococcales bacterium]